MGSSSSTTNQSSSTSPWAAAQPEVQGLLSGVNGLLPNTGLTGAQSGAISQLTQAGQAGNPYAPAVGNVATNLLGGGGATNQAGAVNQNYADYMKATNPLATNTNYNPYNTPGFSDAIGTLTSDITNGVNGQFAAGGRSFSGANSQALGRGISQGVAPVIASQYNANVANQQGAAAAKYGAGNTTANTLSGYNQQGNANSLGGVGAANSALDAQSWGPNQVLAAQELGQRIPTQNLGMLAQIGIPLAQLGTNATGTGTTQNNPSLLTQIGQGTSDATNILKLLGMG